MNILFLTSSFNGMAQRLWIELDRQDHQVHVQIATFPESMLEAVEKYKPQLIIAPFLVKRIPEEIWKNYTCLIVHPGIKGDRGASSLDWAILNKEKYWGVSIIQATEKLDGGPVWASHNFEMRCVSKAEIYRNEVTQAASKGILEAIANFENKDFIPKMMLHSAKEKWNPKTAQRNFNFSWNEKSEVIRRKIHAADSSPGVCIELVGKKYFCFGVHPETKLKGNFGEIIAQRNKALCVATGDASIWITHLKSSEKGSIKLPAVMALGNLAEHIPVSEISPFEKVEGQTWQDIRFEKEDEIGYLHFDFYNGAMDTSQCNRLRDAFIEVKKRVKIIVLMGGRDVWSNGIHLNVIENAENPAEESWENINALDDFILEIIQSTKHYVICALQGNAGAGGVSLALSGDKVISRNGIVLNPHTKNMGLYGSEYWTYLLPKRIGIEKANKFTEECLPWGMAVAHEIGLVDHYFGQTNEEFVNNVKQRATEILNLSYFDKLLKAKQFQRRKDEMNKPLQQYRDEELEQMKADFYENRNCYNEKRHRFVHKTPNDEATKIEDLYTSRRSIYRKRKWESITYKEKP